MIRNLKTSALFGGLFVAAVICAQAQTSNSIVVFSVNLTTNIANGTFVPGTDNVEAKGNWNGYTSGLVLSNDGSGIYTNTLNITTLANGAKLEFKYVKNGSDWEGTVSGDNRTVRLPATSGATLTLPTPFFADGGAAVTNQVTFRVDMAQQINLGLFDTNLHTVSARGTFNGWGQSTLTADPSILRTNSLNQVTSNVYVGTFDLVASPNSAQEYKFFYNNGGDVWEAVTDINRNGGGDRYYDGYAQTLPVFDFSDAPHALTNLVLFQVDMSARVLTGAYSNSMPLSIRGSFNGWGTTAMTNDPAAANTNIYSVGVVLGQGSTVNYKFYYNNGGDVWESISDRSLAVPGQNSTVLPAVFFDNAPLNDLLLTPTPVKFSVDMNGAVGTDAHVFVPGSDRVFINGQFANWYAWYGGVNPQDAPPGYELFEDGLTGVYTNTVTIPAGTSVSFNYKYGIGISGAPGPTDNEAGFGTNHFRVVRSMAFNPYPMPQDKFAIMYGEPLMGDLKAGAPSGGAVPVTWLGRPGARLQATANLAGSWQDLYATDGTNWSTGTFGTNGFVSQTNVPVTDKAFFRTVKPN